MLSKIVLPLVSVSLLLLAPVASGRHIRPRPFPATTESSFSSSSRCHLISSIEYNDQWGPLFSENRYSCNLSEQKPTPRSSTNTLESFRVPPPYDHPAGDQGSDDRVMSTGSIMTWEDDYKLQVQASYSKHSIVDYGCSPLEDSEALSRDKYSNLFWAMSQLTNQSCLDPGEAVEYVDFKRDWTADWRFTNVNRGDERFCDWYSELANIAKALHYFCFHTLGRSSNDEYSGGEEIVAYGKDKSENQQWCMRYSKKGWKSAQFGEKCLGL